MPDGPKVPRAQPLGRQLAHVESLARPHVLCVLHAGAEMLGHEVIQEEVVAVEHSIHICSSLHSPGRSFSRGLVCYMSYDHSNGMVHDLHAKKVKNIVE